MKKPLTDQDIRNISATASMQAFAAALIEINVRYYSEHLDAADPSSLRAASGVAAAQIRDAAACEAAGDAWPFERACMEVAWLCTTHLREQYVTIGGRSYRKLTPPIPGAGVNADFARAPDGKRETEVREMYESERRELDLLEAIVDILHLVDGLLRDYGLRLAPVALDPLVKIKERCSSALAKHRKERETGICRPCRLVGHPWVLGGVGMAASVRQQVATGGAMLRICHCAQPIQSDRRYRGDFFVHPSPICGASDSSHLHPGLRSQGL